MKSNIHTLPIKTNEVHELIESYRDLDRQIKALEKEAIKLKEELKEGYFKDHDEYIHHGRLLAVCRTQERTDIDRTMLKEKYSDIFEACQKVVVSRVFTLK